MATISVVLVVHNEAENIADCLRSCSFADEIIVIDDNSTDGTPDLAKETSPKIKVFTRALAGNWGAQKSFGIDQATSDWVFLIDADERVTPELAEKLKAVTAGAPIGYKVQRSNHLRNIDVTHGVLRPDWVLRMLPREGARVEGLVHEKVVSPYPTQKIHGAHIIHYPYRDWDQYWRKFNQYSGLAAQKAYDEGKRCVFWRDILARPFWAFFKVYVLNGGFLDGKAGWYFSINHFNYTMTKYVRLYYLQKFQGKL